MQAVFSFSLHFPDISHINPADAPWSAKGTVPAARHLPLHDCLTKVRPAPSYHATPPVWNTGDIPKDRRRKTPSPPIPCCGVPPAPVWQSHPPSPWPPVPRLSVHNRPGKSRLSQSPQGPSHQYPHNDRIRRPAPPHGPVPAPSFDERFSPEAIHRLPFFFYIEAVAKKHGIAKVLEQIEKGTITDLGTLQTVKRYLKEIEKLGINPVTISARMTVPKQTIKNQSGGKDLSEKILFNLVDILSTYGDQMEDYQKHGVPITDEVLEQIDKLYQS